MSEGQGSSSIAQAVERLHGARNRVQEVLVHLRAAIEDAHQSRVFRELAFGDSNHELATQSRRAENGAETQLRVALLAIRDAEYGVGQYARLIAPGLSWSDAQTSRPAPEGEGLLVDQERRPRNFSEGLRLAAVKSDDVVNGIESGLASLKAIDSALKPPEVSGVATSNPKFERPPDNDGHVNVGDPISAVLVTSAFFADVIRRFRGRRARKKRIGQASSDSQ